LDIMTSGIEARQTSPHTQSRRQDMFRRACVPPDRQSPSLAARSHGTIPIRAVPRTAKTL
jgi:hypothetical protein